MQFRIWGNEMKIPKDQPVASRDIINAFSESYGQNDTVQVLNKLFDKDILEMITELSDDEIAIVSRIFGISELKNLEIWKKVANIYISLVISRKRKGRTEVIDAIGRFDMKKRMSRLFGSPYGGGQGGFR